MGTVWFSETCRSSNSDRLLVKMVSSDPAYSGCLGGKRTQQNEYVLRSLRCMMMMMMVLLCWFLLFGVLVKIWNFSSVIESLPCAASLVSFPRSQAKDDA